MKTFEITSYVLAAIVFFLLLHYGLAKTFNFSICLAAFVFVLPMLVKLLSSKFRKN